MVQSLFARTVHTRFADTLCPQDSYLEGRLGRGRRAPAAASGGSDARLLLELQEKLPSEVKLIVVITDNLI